jgi:hypothetical protein
MTKKRKKSSANVDDLPVVTYTFDAEGRPLTRTTTQFGGTWISTAYLQPISQADIERNLYENIG